LVAVVVVVGGESFTGGITDASVEGGSRCRGVVVVEVLPSSMGYWRTDARPHSPFFWVIGVGTSLTGVEDGVVSMSYLIKQAAEQSWEQQ